ncbi:MAG TPA: hypothetical protein VGH06_03025 [Candidatus Udaeobacter sp.]
MKRFVVCVVGLTLVFCVLTYGSARDPSNYFFRTPPASAPLKVEPVWFAPKPDYPAMHEEVI